MGFFSKLSQALQESAARQKAEQQALNERMRQYHRGYDVYPEQVCSYFVGRLRRKLIPRLLIKLLFIGLAAAGGIVTFFSGDTPFVFLMGIVLLFLTPFALVDISRLMRISAGKYDAFGAMVTKTYVEEHTTTDSDGQTSTSYTYFTWLNGIKCEVSSGEFHKVGVGTYCYFIRLKAKYISSDQFYFFPTDPAEQSHRIGQHYPSSELRLYKAPPAHVLTTLLFGLGLLGGIGSLIALVVTEGGTGGTTSLFAWTALGGGVTAVIGIIAMTVSKNIRAERLIEEKKRSGHHM